MPSRELLKPATNVSLGYPIGTQVNRATSSKLMGKGQGEVILSRPYVCLDQRQEGKAGRK